MTENGPTGVADETIVEVLRGSEHPALKTTQVAAELPITQGRTRTRLQALADEGAVERERVGIDVVWWLAERADEVGEDPSLAVRPDKGSEDLDPAVEPADGQADDDANAPESAADSTVDSASASGSDPDSVPVEAVDDVDTTEEPAGDAATGASAGADADETDRSVGLDRDEPRVVEFEDDDGPPVALAVGVLLGVLLLWLVVRRLRR